MRRPEQPVCPMCSEDGIHASVDACLATLRQAVAEWSRPRTVRTPVPRPITQCGGRRLRTRAEIARIRTLYREHTASALAGMLSMTLPRVKYVVSGRSKAIEDDPRSRVYQMT